MLSRSRRTWTARQLPIYLEAGVKHVWLVDPVEQTLEVYERGEEPRWREVRTYAGDAHVRAAPFDAIELDLASLWSKPRRR